MPDSKSTETAPVAFPNPRAAQLAAVVEAAYILEAIRR
jgi:hypothetical protein